MEMSQSVLEDLLEFIMLDWEGLIPDMVVDLGWYLDFGYWILVAQGALDPVLRHHDSRTMMHDESI